MVLATTFAKLWIKCGVEHMECMVHVELDGVSHFNIFTAREFSILFRILLTIDLNLSEIWIKIG